MILWSENRTLSSPHYALLLNHSVDKKGDGERERSSERFSESVIFMGSIMTTGY